jgi:hypothetical protein
MGFSWDRVRTKRHRQRSQLKSHQRQRKEGREKCIYRFLTAEVVRWRKGAELSGDEAMTMRFVTVPVPGQARQERMKVILGGNHTLEEKMIMAMKALTVLEHPGG